MSFSNTFKNIINHIEEQNQSADPRGLKVKESILSSFMINPATPIANFEKRKFNWKYLAGELAWYLKKNRDVDFIGAFSNFWGTLTNPDSNEINSNYGHLIYSDLYHNQFEQVVMELTRNKDSRRASMIYTRPSIWIEYNDQGKNDFICTNSVTYYIRDDVLHCVVQMRSNDVIFGYRNDYAWQEYVLCELADELGVDDGDIHWQVQNLHVYERHFDLVK